MLRLYPKESEWIGRATRTGMGLLLWRERRTDQRVDAARPVEIESAETINRGLRRHIHALEGHYARFDQCPNRWCNPKPGKDPAVLMAKVDDNNAGITLDSNQHEE